MNPCRDSVVLAPGACTDCPLSVVFFASRLEALALRVEAIASRLEAIAIKLVGQIL